MAHRTSTWQLDGLHLVDHVLDVPLDHDDPGGGTIEVFARVVSADDGADRPSCSTCRADWGRSRPGRA